MIRSGIHRNREMIVPNGDTVLEHGDHVTLLSDAATMQIVRGLVGPSTE